MKLSDKERIKELEKENKLLREMIKLLEQRIEELTRALYGRRSEKTKKVKEDEEQLVLFEEVKDIEEYSSTPPEKDDDAIEKTPSVPKKSKKRGRKLFPEHIKRVVVDCEIPENEKYDESGVKLSVIGYRESEKLKYIPGHFEILVIRRPILGYKDSREYVKVIECPSSIVPRGKLSDDTIHNFVYEKYFNGMPLTRQLNSLKNFGVDLPISTISDNIKKFSELYEPVYEEIKKEIFSSKFVHADESPLKYGNKKDKFKKGYMFVYRDNNQAYFHYGLNRTQEEISSTLSPPNNNKKEYFGYLMCDGYSGYNKYSGKRLACWAHGRRKFFSIAGKNRDAKLILDMINSLYSIERDAREKLDSGVLNYDEYLKQLSSDRSLKSKKIIDEIETKLSEFEAKYTPSSSMGKAMKYVRERWPNFKIYLEDPELPIDNNAAERSIRSMVVGRKNYYFVGSEDAGKWSAISYTLMESCRIQGINPIEYLKKTTEKLLSIRDKKEEIDISTLTPLNFK